MFYICSIYVEIIVHKLVVILFSRKDEVLEVIPVSSKLLFYPPVKTVTIKGKGEKMVKCDK